MKSIAPLSLAVLAGASFYCSSSQAIAASAATRANDVFVNSATGGIRPLVAQARPRIPFSPSDPKTTTVRYSRSATAGNMVTPAILLGMPIMVILALIIMAAKGD